MLTQVNVDVVELVAFGGVVFEVITAVAVFVQPLAGFVTVKVYVPAALTVATVVAAPDTTPGPVQLKVAPLVDELPVTVAVVEVQLKLVMEDALAFGTTVFEVTVTVAVLTHPFAGSVTVTV